MSGNAAGFGENPFLFGAAKEQKTNRTEKFFSWFFMVLFNTSFKTGRRKIIPLPRDARKRNNN